MYQTPCYRYTLIDPTPYRFQLLDCEGLSDKRLASKNQQLSFPSLSEPHRCCSLHSQHRPHFILYSGPLLEVCYRHTSYALSYVHYVYSVFISWDMMWDGKPWINLTRTSSQRISQALRHPSVQLCISMVGKHPIFRW